MKKAAPKKAQPKTSIKKKASKPSQRKKKGFSEGLQAFLLVGLIVVFAIFVSLVIISIHSSLNRRSNIDGITQTPQPVTNPQTTDPAPQTPDIPGSTITQPVVTTPENPAPNTQNPTAVTQRPTPSPQAQRPPSPPAANNSNTTTVITPKPTENRGTLVFVIDDAGNNLRELEPFLRIQGPLTIAVLPGLPYSAEAARRIRAAGKEVILHQPMEAIGAQNPGPGAIYSGMSPAEIKSILAHNIAEVGPVTGMNNHQGSKITMDREAMQVILEFCAENKIYFLDSRTTADSVVPSVANQMGIKIAERNVFIDNEQNKDAMLRYITGGLTRAQRSGLSVMIGHAWSPDLAPLLAEQFPRFIEQGYTIKTAFDIIK